MSEFTKDAVILAEEGEWNLVIYANRCVSLIKKDDSEIKSLSCCVEDEDGYVTDEARLLDKLGELYMSKVSECKKLVKMPRELTAENGAKYHMIGEFHEAVTLSCPDCDGEGDVDGEPCDECDSVGTYVVKVPIHWTTIKEIYAKAVKHLSTT